MSVFATVLLVSAVIIAIYLVMIYNNLVEVKHNVAKAWANIDVLLKQRHDELPKLVETCKQYMKFEQDTLQKVIDARSRVFAARESKDIGALGTAEAGLRSSVGSLLRRQHLSGALYERLEVHGLPLMRSRVADG